MLNNKNSTVQELKKQFIQECTDLYPKKEHPGFVGKEKAIIATDLTQKELVKKYSVFIDYLEPYILVKKRLLMSETIIIESDIMRVIIL